MVSTKRQAKRSRILVVIGTLEVGGAEMDLVRNLPAIDHHRFEVVVYTFTAPGPLARRMQAAGIPVESGPPRDGPASAPVEAASAPTATGFAAGLLAAVRRSGLPRPAIARIPVRLYFRVRHIAAYILEVAAVIRPLRRFIIDHRINIVHCVLPNAYFYGTIAAILAGKPNIVMSRLSLNHYQEKMPFYRKVERRLLHKLVKVAVGNAEAVLDDLRNEGIPERKLFLLRNGIDTRPFEPTADRRAKARSALGISAETFLITAVGNLWPYKGHADLIEGLASVEARLPPAWRLVIAGGDRKGHEAVLRQLTAELKLSDRVALLGHRDDIPDLLAASDLHVMPSHEEGLPNSVIEAMAAGLPVVATRVGGIPELLTDGENGILVPAHSPQALGEAVVTLASDAAARRTIGARNAEKAREQFGLRRSVARYEALYSLLSRAMER